MFASRLQLLLCGLVAYVVVTMISFASAGQIVQTIDTYRLVYKKFPELNGVTADEAKAVLRSLHDVSGFTIEVRNVKDGVVADLNLGSITLYVNDENEVVFTPETVVRVPHQITFKKWPEAVGLSSERAKAVIIQDMPDARFEVLPEGSPVTLDLRTDRVRLFVNDDDIVVSIPSNG